MQSFGVGKVAFLAEGLALAYQPMVDTILILVFTKLQKTSGPLEYS